MVLTAYRNQFQSDEIFRDENLLQPSLFFFCFFTRSHKANVFNCRTSPLLSLLGLFFQLSITVLSANIQSSIICLGLPFVFFPIAASLLLVCPIRLFCLFLIVCIRDLSSPIIASTSSFVVSSVQLIFSIILFDRTSKAFIHFVSPHSRSTSLIHTAPLYSTYLFLSSASSDSCLVYFSVGLILSSLRN